MNHSFSSQTLTDKLSKLNSTQQSIESLSKWCISYRKKARQIVETWEKMFSSSTKEKRISFLYLANDILQNSRREGSEFVNEFWKLLPGALKSVIESGDDHGKTVVIRLVSIWDERKVFGSRGQDLKNKMLGDKSISLLENNGMNSQPIKMVKKDARTIRFKLAVGGMPEKIVTAFQSLHDEHCTEDAAIDKCNAAISSVKKSEKDVENACAQVGNQQVSSTLTSELQEKETILMQCIEQLEGIEATRVALISQLKEALHEQESKLELTCNQLQVARAELEHASNMRKRLTSTSVQIVNTLPVDTTAADYKLPNHVPNVQLQQSSQPISSFTSSFSTADEQHKKAAAAVAAKLAASTSSEQILNSVLSSFVAEEAASKNGGPKPESFTNSPPAFSMAKRAKLEKPMAVSEMGNSYLSPVSQQQLSSAPPQVSTSFQPMAQMNPPQPPFPPPQPQPLPPPTQQYAQTSGMMVGAVPFGYGNTSLPPPPVQPQVLMGLTRASVPQTTGPQPSGLPAPQLSQQQAVTTGFNQPQGMTFFGQPAAAPVPRQ